MLFEEFAVRDFAVVHKHSPLFDYFDFLLKLRFGL